MPTQSISSNQPVYSALETKTDTKDSTSTTKSDIDLSKTEATDALPKLEVVASVSMREHLKENLTTSVCAGAAIGATSLMALGPAGAGIGAILGGLVGVVQCLDLCKHFVAMDADTATHARVDPFYADTDMYDNEGHDDLDFDLVPDIYD